MQLNLQTMLDEYGMTSYGIALLIGAETDEPIKTIHRRWQRWLSGELPNLKTLQSDLKVLGYELEVKVVKNTSARFDK